MTATHQSPRRATSLRRCRSQKDERMSGPTTRQHRSRVRWIIPAIIAALLFLGGVAGNLVATDLDPVSKPYRVWVWIFFFVALAVTVFVAVREYNRQDESPDPQDEPVPKSEPPPVPRRA